MNDSVALAPFALDSLRPQLTHILEQAIIIARGAGEILRAGFEQITARRAALDLRFKSTDFDPVTEYDTAAKPLSSPRCDAPSLTTTS